MPDDRRETIEVIDHGTVLSIPFEACVAYHGRTSIGGVALGFRFLQYVFSRLSPDAPPDREEISVFTAFPGPGFRDTIEMVTRAVSRGAYRVDTEADVPGPEGVIGRLFFEPGIAGRHIRLALVEGGLSPEFIQVGRRTKTGHATPKDLSRWTELKEQLARNVMAARPGDLFVELPGK